MCIGIKDKRCFLGGPLLPGSWACCVWKDSRRELIIARFGVRAAQLTALCSDKSGDGAS